MFKYVFGHQGKTEGFLWYPRKVAVLVQSESFVVCDRGGERSRMQIFDCMGQYSHAISIRYLQYAILLNFAICVERGALHSHRVNDQHEKQTLL